MLQKPKVVVILGATATGKSHCAIEIAKQFQGEIISGDSMLVYKNMNIGTAKPTAEELAAVPHHLVDILPPDASFSVVDFKERAAALITEINARGHLPIIAGGTGLYIKALLEDYAFNNADEDSELRRIDQVAEFMRGTEADGGRVKPDRLVAPRPIKGKLADRHQFDMCEGQFFYIGDKFVCQFPEGEKAIRFGRITLP